MTESLPDSEPLGEPSTAPSRAALPSPRVLQSADLLQGQLEVLIRHGDDTYRLRVTQNGRLIMQK